MILGILLAKKRYPAAKFLFILMIVIGVSLFLYKDQQKSTVADDKPIIGIGELLLVCTIKFLNLRTPEIFEVIPLNSNKKVIP